MSGNLGNQEGKQSSNPYKRPISEKKKIFANSTSEKGLAFQDL